MNRPDLSVITVCMNRQHHLLATARTIAAWPHHQEHLILDWSSRVPVERAQLPPDPRIRLERVDGEQRWNLCRAQKNGCATNQRASYWRSTPFPGAVTSSKKSWAIRKRKSIF